MRLGRGRGGRAGAGEPGGGLTDDLSRLLRPALELALDVARAGKALQPSMPVPRAVERVVGFAKLPAPAWDDLRRAVDGDEDFRSRVAIVADEEDVGRAGWLWLHRPDGWEDELADLARSASFGRNSDVAAAERRARRQAEREARRRQRGLEEERDAARRELAESDDARRRGEAAMAVIEAEAARLREERLTAVRRATDAERRLAAKGAEAKALAEEVARLRTPVADGQAGEGDPVADAGTTAAPEAAPPVREASGHEPEGSAGAGAVGELRPVEAADGWSGVDRGAVAGHVEAAARAASDLAAALESVAGLLRVPPADASPLRPSPLASAGTDGRTSAARPPRGSGQGSGRRRPLRLPGGVEEGSAEAAAWLVRQPAAIVIDGYNVSRSAWDHLPIAEQRERLLDALEELEARTGADLHVVFDGAAEEATFAARRRGGRRVRVTFSPGGVEADDVVLELVASEPQDRPVVVATSDGRVRTGAAGQGANVISAHQLIAVLRR